MSFQCVLVTPEQQLFDETVTQAIVPAHDGQVGILTDRAPLLVKLGIGALQLDLAGGQRRTLFIEGGLLLRADDLHVGVPPKNYGLWKNEPPRGRRGGLKASYDLHIIPCPIH